MAPEPVRFEVSLQRVGKTGVAILVPIDMHATFGRHRPPLRVRIKEYQWRTTPARYGDEYWIVVNRAAQEGAAVDAGDQVEVELELDTEERTVEVPGDLAEALADAQLREGFDRMSFSHRREYVEWIEGAKRPETRERRIAQAIERIAAGKPQR